MDEIHKLRLILELNIPLDSFLSAISGKPKIDLFELDEILLKKYKYKGAMKDFISKKFGKTALEIIEKNLASDSAQF